MKVAAVQFNPIVGDVYGNAKRMYGMYVDAVKNGAELVVFPECAISGYPIEDLAQKPDFIAHVERATGLLIAAVKATGKVGIIFGAPRHDTDYLGKRVVRNSAYCYDPVSDDLTIINKTCLPNYGVFDEKRTFTAGDDNTWCWPYRGFDLFVMICEDAWHKGVSPQRDRADLIISINGSPFEIGKNVVRKTIVTDRIKENMMSPFLYVNMVGGEDEIVFDGNSFLIDSNGYTEAASFIENTHYFDVVMKVDANTASTILEPTGVEAVYKAQVLGTRDFFVKQGFKSAVIGYSGGVDSGGVAAIACDALGAENVYLVSLPSKYSDQASKDDAFLGAQRLGANYRVIPIEPIVEALRVGYTSAQYPLGGKPKGEMELKGYEVFGADNDHPKLTGVADENIQARARGNILMAISNQEGHMVLSTGNKSEVSLGYATLYGDMSGGFNPIKDCPKTLVWALCRWRNELKDPASLGFFGRETIVVPDEIIDKIPSAGLSLNQVDPFDYLNETDPILALLVDQAMSVDDVIAAGFDPVQVNRHYNLLVRSEYKRRQSCPGIKLTSKLHGRDRRIPIVYRDPKDIPDSLIQTPELADA